MPVYKLKEEMPYTELLQWINYFDLRPVDWREDMRAYLYLRTQGVTEKAEKIFPSLKFIFNEKEIKDDQVLPTGAFLDKILTAKGGDDWSFYGGNVKNKS